MALHADPVHPEIQVLTNLTLYLFSVCYSLPEYVMILLTLHNYSDVIVELVSLVCSLMS